MWNRKQIFSIKTLVSCKQFVYSNSIVFRAFKMFGFWSVGHNQYTCKSYAKISLFVLKKCRPICYKQK